MPSFSDKAVMEITSSVPVPDGFRRPMDLASSALGLMTGSLLGGAPKPPSPRLGAVYGCGDGPL